MAVNLTAFREPRGVMRILQFVFAICAFASTSGYSGQVKVTPCSGSKEYKIEFSYPFQLDHISTTVSCTASSNGSQVSNTFQLQGDFSSDAQFFVASGVLAFLYCIGIVAVYALFEEKYQSNSMLPLVDFVITTILAVFWLSSSAAWANGLSGLKSVTDTGFLDKYCVKVLGGTCTTLTSSFSGLNISVILGFLNFFLWASDLWFLYKETHWFKIQQETSSGAAGGV